MKQSYVNTINELNQELLAIREQSQQSNQTFEEVCSI
jgi:hypothetical protein